jgi:hypothetical protein
MRGELCLFPLRERLARTLTSRTILSVRRRSGPVRDLGVQASFESFIKAAVGRKIGIPRTVFYAYAWPLLHLVFYVALPSVSKGEPQGPNNVSSSFFCSMLVAEALLQMEIVRRIHSSRMLPCHFSSPHGDRLLGRHCAEGHSYALEEQLLGWRANTLRAKALRDELASFEMFLKEESKERMEVLRAIACAHLE